LALIGNDISLYLLELILENGGVRFQNRKDSRTIAKWTHLGDDKAARELLTFITIGIGGDRYLPFGRLHAR